MAYRRNKQCRLSRASVDSALSQLRQQRLERKMFSVKKLVQRAAKKARTFAIQRCIKKVKLAEKEEKKKRAEEEMRAIKALDLAAVARALFAEKVAKSSEYLAQRLASFIEDPSAPADQVRLIDGNGLNRALAEISQTTEAFVRNLYRESVEPAAATTSSTAPSSKFITSLAAQSDPVDSRVQAPGQGRLRDTRDPHASSPTGGKRPRRHPASGEEDEEVRPKNRKGQRARRAEWERLYGSQALHLQVAAPPPKALLPRPATTTQRPTRSAPPKSAAKADAPAATKLHPSWEAQRRQRELLKTAVSQRPANSRIKFADDD